MILIKPPAEEEPDSEFLLLRRPQAPSFVLFVTIKEVPVGLRVHQTLPFVPLFRFPGAHNPSVCLPSVPKSSTSLFRSERACNMWSTKLHTYIFRSTQKFTLDLNSEAIIIHCSAMYVMINLASQTPQTIIMGFVVAFRK